MKIKIKLLYQGVIILKNEEYKEYLKISKDPVIKMVFLIFLIIYWTVAIIYSFFINPKMKYFCIFMYLIFMITYIIGFLIFYKIDSDKWKVAKGTFNIINKNRGDVILVDIERKDDKPRRQMATRIFKHINKEDTIEAIYKYRIIFGGKRIYKILEILKVNDKDNIES